MSLVYRDYLIMIYLRDYGARVTCPVCGHEMFIINLENHLMLRHGLSPVEVRVMLVGVCTKRGLRNGSV